MAPSFPSLCCKRKPSSSRIKLIFRRLLSEVLKCIDPNIQILTKIRMEFENMSLSFKELELYEIISILLERSTKVNLEVNVKELCDICPMLKEKLESAIIEFKMNQFRDFYDFLQTAHQPIITKCIALAGQFTAECMIRFENHQEKIWEDVNEMLNQFFEEQNIISWILHTPKITPSKQLVPTVPCCKCKISWTDRVFRMLLSESIQMAYPMDIENLTKDEKLYFNEKELQLYEKLSSLLEYKHIFYQLDVKEIKDICPVLKEQLKCLVNFQSLENMTIREILESTYHPIVLNCIILAGKFTAECFYRFKNHQEEIFKAVITLLFDFFKEQNIVNWLQHI